APETAVRRNLRRLRNRAYSSGEVISDEGISDGLRISMIDLAETPPAPIRHRKGTASYMGVQRIWFQVEKGTYSFMRLCRPAAEDLDNAGRLPRGNAVDWRTTSRVGMCHSLRLARGLSGSTPARRASTAAAARWLQDI